MRKLVLDKKTGYEITDPYKPVVIRDYRGMLFYTTEPLLPKVTKFNLPEGTYFIDSGFFRKMPAPVKYHLADLPMKERSFDKPYDFKLVFGTNPNKCSIFWDEKTILFDDSLKDYSLPELFFILYHEIGHSYYLTEKYADLFAANFMLIKGFNPSQITTAPITSLSSKQLVRKQNIIDKISQ